MEIMNKQTTLHFFCGKMAAGKSTLAQSIVSGIVAEQKQAVLLVEDEWLTALYPEQINTIADYVEYSARLKKILFPHIKSLLGTGVIVVLDFPANTQQQRRWFRSLIEQSNSAHQLHYVDKTDAVCKMQLKLRNQDKPETAAFTSAESFDLITQYFQAPLDSEGFNLIRN